MIYRLPPPALPLATLQANLAAAQAALDQLLRGARVATASYSEGGGTRSVTYTKTDVGTLRNYIDDLQSQLGYRARRAIGVRFG